MTSYFPDYEAIEKERQDKEAAGYLCVDGNAPLFTGDHHERIPSIKVEALAAELIWDRESVICSARDQGVTEAGKRFFVLSDHFTSGPWNDFYIKPGMLQDLISCLDGNRQVAEVRTTYMKESKPPIYDEALLLTEIDNLDLPTDEGRLDEILQQARAHSTPLSPILSKKLAEAFCELAGRVHLDAEADRFSPPESGWEWALELWKTLKTLRPDDKDIDRLMNECQSRLR